MLLGGVDIQRGELLLGLESKDGKFGDSSSLHKLLMQLLRDPHATDEHGLRIFRSVSVRAYLYRITATSRAIVDRLPKERPEDGYATELLSDKEWEDLRTHASLILRAYNTWVGVEGLYIETALVGRVTKATAWANRGALPEHEARPLNELDYEAFLEAVEETHPEAGWSAAADVAEMHSLSVLNKTMTAQGSTLPKKTANQRRKVFQRLIERACAPPPALKTPRGHKTRSRRETVTDDGSSSAASTGASEGSSADTEETAKAKQYIANKTRRRKRSRPNKQTREARKRRRETDSEAESDARAPTPPPKKKHVDFKEKDKRHKDKKPKR